MSERLDDRAREKLSKAAKGLDEAIAGWMAERLEEPDAMWTDWLLRQLGVQLPEDDVEADEAFGTWTDRLWLVHSLHVLAGVLETRPQLREEFADELREALG